jgi:hypothetical protein
MRTVPEKTVACPDPSDTVMNGTIEAMSAAITTTSNNAFLIKYHRWAGGLMPSY